MKKVSCLQFITAGSYVDVSSTDVNWFLTVFRAGGVFQGSDEEGPGHGLCCGRYPHSARIPQAGQRCVGLMWVLWTKLPCFRWTITLFIKLWLPLRRHLYVLIFIILTILLQFSVHLSRNIYLFFSLLEEMLTSRERSSLNDSRFLSFHDWTNKLTLKNNTVHPVLLCIT